jgi:hypothetical protein
MLVAAIFMAGALVPGSHARRWGTEEAIARLDRIKTDLAEQEKLVEALHKVVNGAKDMTCSAHDHKCHRTQRHNRRRFKVLPLLPDSASFV